MRPIVLALPFLLVGCAANPSEPTPTTSVSTTTPTPRPTTPSTETTLTPVAETAEPTKGPSLEDKSIPPLVEATPPTNIGDGSPIAFTHWNGVRKGSGKLTESGKTTDILAFEAELKPDKKMTLDLQGTGKSHFTGMWSKRDDKTIDFMLDQGAMGEMGFMDRANPSTLKFNGQGPGGKPLKLEFKVEE